MAAGASRTLRETRGLTSCALRQLQCRDLGFRYVFMYAGTKEHRQLCFAVAVKSCCAWHLSAPSAPFLEGSEPGNLDIQQSDPVFREPHLPPGHVLEPIGAILSAYPPVLAML